VRFCLAIPRGHPKTPFGNLTRLRRAVGKPPARGEKPVVCAAPEQQQAVIHRLQQLGPGTGLAVLQGAFPELARAELQGFSSFFLPC
jgi:hypothetical protein